MWIFGPRQKEWQVLCTNLSYLGHPCGAILDTLGIPACLLLTPPSLVFIHWLSDETTQMV